MTRLSDNLRRIGDSWAIEGGQYADASPRIQSVLSTNDGAPWAIASPEDTVYRWHEHRRLPAHRVGRLCKFKVFPVDEWVRAGGADEGADPHKQTN